MCAIDYPAVFDDLLDLLAESADVNRVLAFRLSDEKQARLDDLLEKKSGRHVNRRRILGIGRL